MFIVRELVFSGVSINTKYLDLGTVVRTNYQHSNNELKNAVA